MDAIDRWLIGAIVTGASTSTTPETKRRWRGESGEDMNSTTTTSAGPYWLSSPFPRARDGHSESISQLATFSNLFFKNIKSLNKKKILLNPLFQLLPISSLPGSFSTPPTSQRKTWGRVEATGWRCRSSTWSTLWFSHSSSSTSSWLWSSSPSRSRATRWSTSAVWRKTR